MEKQNLHEKELCESLEKGEVLWATDILGRFLEQVRIGISLEGI